MSFRLPFQFAAFGQAPNSLILLEAALIIALAVQGARLFWMMVTPAGAFGPAPVSAPVPARADVAILARFDPFFRGVPDGGASGGDGGFTLFGVRMAANRSTAILATPDGRQDSFALGQSIAPGVVLSAVERDHVILTRGGMRMRVAFQTPAPTAPAAQVPPPGPATQMEQGGTIAPRDFLSQTGFEPQMQGGEVRGYVVSPRDGGKILAAAGLQPGDVIRAINGQVLGRHRFEEIESEFSGASQVEFTIERGGQTITKKMQVAK